MIDHTTEVTEVTTEYRGIPTVSAPMIVGVTIQKHDGLWQVWINGHQIVVRHDRRWSHYVERPIESFAKLSEAKAYVLGNPGVIKSEIAMLEGR